MAIGMPLGACSGIFFPLLYGWNTPLHLTGLAGLFLGPLVVAWAVLQAFLVVLVMFGIKNVVIAIYQAIRYLFQQIV